MGSSTSTQFVTVRGPLVAEFAATVNNRTASFTDQSLGDPTTFSWTFGDGTAGSTIRNPEHAYATAGIYNVTLTVTRPALSDTPQESASVSHSVTVPPTAGATP